MEIAKFERHVGALQIIYCLPKDMQSMMISELSEKIKVTNETLDTTVKFLCAEGLVLDAKTATFPRRRLVSLTPKGVGVARHLAEIEVLIGKR